MFSYSDLPEGRIVPWSRLEPGMIFLSGLTVNNAAPHELTDYPILDRRLIDTLHDRYRLRKDRNVKVLAPGAGGAGPRECADLIHEASNRVVTLNSFRKKVRQKRRDLNVAGGDVLKTDLVKGDSLVFPYAAGRSRPSLLNRLDFSLDVSDLFFRDFRQKMNLPADREMDVFLVVDYSYSMKATGRDVYVQSAVNVFFRNLEQLLRNARFHLYGFSDNCRTLAYPVTGDEVPRKETRYTAFLDEVLWRADESHPCLVILFTDGLPSDRALALKRLAMVRGRGLDYMQIIFNMEGDKREFVVSDGRDTLDGYALKHSDDAKRLSGSDYRSLIKSIKKDFSELADTAGGGQIIMNIDEALALVSVESFDKWLGFRDAGG